MCTAIVHRRAGGFLARNLDLHTLYGQQIVITPRGLSQGYAMLGAAVMRGTVPLYFDAVNEAGLAAAALAFEDECVYAASTGAPEELAPFALIPFVLSRCATVSEAKRLLERTRVAAIPFSPKEPLTPLHWLIADREESVVVEPLADGLCLADDPPEVLTNSPRLSYQLTHLAEYASLQTEEPSHRLGLSPPHRGYGLKGLPGDFTPSSRFVKAAFLKSLLPKTMDVTAGMLDSFRVLDSVAYLHGAMPHDGQYAFTQYSSVCHLPGGTYYYKTYGDPTVRAVSLSRAPTDGTTPIVYPMTDAFRVTEEN